MAGGRIKGAALAGGIEELRNLRDAGRISGEQLEAMLAAEDLALIDGKLEPASWYPVAIADRVASLLFRLEGGGRVEYLHKRGRLAAERLIDSGLYQQLDGLSGAGVASLGEFRLMVRLAVSVQGALFDVGRWSVETDAEHPARLRIVIDDAADFPESMRHNIEGFFRRACQEARIHAGWLSERPTRDRVVYRMDADFEVPR